MSGFQGRVECLRGPKFAPGSWPQKSDGAGGERPAECQRGSAKAESDGMRNGPLQEQRFEGRQTISEPLQRLRPLFPPSSNSRRWFPLPAITTSGDCSGDSVLQALRPSSTGWTLRSSKMAASTRFTSSSTTRTIRGRGRKAAHAQSATAFHGACQRAADLIATERNKSMSSASKLVAFIPRTEAPESKDR